MRATATGSYLRITLEALRCIKKAGWHATGTTEVVGVVANGGWKENELGLTSCEDSSVVRFFDSAGKDVTPRTDRRYRASPHSRQTQGPMEGVGGDNRQGNQLRGATVPGLARCIVGIGLIGILGSTLWVPRLGVMAT